MWSKAHQPAISGHLFNDRPDRLGRKPFPQAPPALLMARKQRTGSDSGWAGPVIDSILHPTRHRNGSDVTALAMQIRDHPVSFAKLNIFDFQNCSFRPSQATTDQDVDQGAVPPFLSESIRRM